MKHRLTRSLNTSVITLSLALLLPCSAAFGVTATGGTKTTIPSYTLHTFTETGTNTFSVTQSGYVDVLLIGGGGGGGRDGGGGGGAGGFVQSNRVFVEKGSNYNVIVGSGGSGASASLRNGVRGMDSTFAEAVAYGGGGGATRSAPSSDPNIHVGSGGGGAYDHDGSLLGTDGQGHAGGIGVTSFTAEAGVELMQMEKRERQVGRQEALAVRQHLQEQKPLMPVAAAEEHEGAQETAQAGWVAAATAAITPMSARTVRPTQAAVEEAVETARMLARADQALLLSVIRLPIHF